MAQKWNLQDIRPPERKKKKRPVRQSAQQDSVDTAPEQSHIKSSRTRRRSGGRRGILKAALIIVGVIVIAFALTPFLRGAEITVYPKHEDITVQASFVAYNQPSAGELGYELLTLEEVREETVPATGQEEVDERAEGEIIIYNEYSTTPQRLIKNTRFESPEGRIYRIPESIVVSGYTENGGEIVPGSITSTVFADEPGDAYNTEEATFTIPGLEGTDQFEDMYARVQTPIAGGFSGLKFIVEDALLAQRRADMQASAETELRERLESERPAGFHYFPDSVTITSQQLPSMQSGDSEVTLREKVELHVPLFANNELARYLAENTTVGYEGEPVRVQNLENIAFAYASTSKAITGSESIQFALSGNALLVWDYDEEALQNDLTGVSKTAVPAILGGYPAISRAESAIRPFWKRSFPEDSDDIHITEVVE